MKALLVGLVSEETTREEALSSIRELSGLLEALGGKSLGYILQRRKRPDPRYFIGEGKAQEVREVAKGTQAEAVIFDDFLSPSQHRNLEDLLKVRVLDRTDLVLEIFSRRAKSKEAKLQVELARLNHQLPRLYGRGKELSRLGGGLGSRGPGEQEAEVRRRILKKRIHQIKQELEEVKKRRRMQRKRRESEEKKLLKVALVGYTNAGKSSLMRALTGRDTFVADMLFATLDTKTSSRFSEGTKILFTDTVGFIRKLPPELIESFKATLEEVKEADVLLIVVDVSDDAWIDHVHTVKEVLKDLNAENKPIVYALNKVDRIVDSLEDANHLPHPAFLEEPAVVVSAVKRWNLDKLLQTIKEVGYEHKASDEIPRGETLQTYDRNGRLS